jgi:hypothetical protein
MTFRLRPDGKLSDLFLDSIDGDDFLNMACPKCGCKNRPFRYTYMGYGGDASRTYVYCCPVCRIHYWDWNDETWKCPGPKRCEKNRLRILEKERESWLALKNLQVMNGKRLSRKDR